ncbi:unnamed protein product [Arctogadus glacialis]
MGRDCDVRGITMQASDHMLNPSDTILETSDNMPVSTCRNISDSRLETITNTLFVDEHHVQSGHRSAVLLVFAFSMVNQQTKNTNQRLGAPEALCEAQFRPQRGGASGPQRCLLARLQTHGHTGSGGGGGSGSSALLTGSMVKGS